MALVCLVAVSSTGRRKGTERGCRRCVEVGDVAIGPEGSGAFGCDDVAVDAEGLSIAGCSVVCCSCSTDSGIGSVPIPVVVCLVVVPIVGGGMKLGSGSSDFWSPGSTGDLFQ